MDGSSWRQNWAAAILTPLSALDPGGWPRLLHSVMSPAEALQCGTLANVGYCGLPSRRGRRRHGGAPNKPLYRNQSVL